jgi:hypothetical protein
MAMTSTASRTPDVSPPVTASPGAPRGVASDVRVASAVLIVVSLSSAPFVSLNRWIVDEPLSLERWPYVYSMWGAALLGAAFFVLDIVAPMTARPLAHSEMLLVAMAAPVALALWAVLSAFWSESPTRTPQEALLMSLVILTAMWFGYGLTFRQQVWSLFVGLHVLSLSSFVLSILLDSARVADEDAWVGLFNTPNALSPVATMGIVAGIGACC